ncbi:trans-acting enoyl reductase family protein, partial [Litorivivens sp.]|uniref:saccharopine dehydrogenase family protein n=1 Tax=Litorivivens sp. TaxID=2020868 RepID=UPI003568C6EF
MSDTNFDVIVFGATSFVGQIVCEYLLNEQPDKSLRWAAAARSESKLRTLQSELGANDETMPLRLADANDPESLAALCRQTRVMISTVGPYALFGEPMVKACVETGTDYCDLTGETQWIKRMVDAYDTQAKETGARIVHCCGFDSIPSDLGVHFLQNQAQTSFGQPAVNVKLRVKAMRGGFSGGTAASLVNVIKEASKDPALRKALANP